MPTNNIKQHESIMADPPPEMEQKDDADNDLRQAIDVARQKVLDSYRQLRQRQNGDKEAR